jgi:predicted PurR-regulated permease PerM
MENEKKVFNISITIGTIFKILAVFLLMYFLYLARDILAILFISLIFASAVDPWVDWLQKNRIPRSLGVLSIYLVMFAVLSLVLFLIIPPIVQEVGDLANNFPFYLDKVIQGFSALRDYSVQHGLIDNIQSGLGSISSNLQDAASSIFSTVLGVFGGIFSFFLVLVITFYMAVEENAIKKLIWSVAPARHQAYAMQLINRIQRKIGMWLRGQLILSFSIFLLTYLGLLILGVKYALVLALIAGLTEFVPYLGPILGAVPAVFLALTQSPVLALFVGLFYYIVQLTENNILVPKIMQKAVGLNPIISMSALMIGYKVGGIVGAILSIPVATALSVIVGDIFESRRNENPDAEFEG